MNEWTNLKTKKTKIKENKRNFLKYIFLRFTLHVL